ncbi:kinase-like protein [Alternaria alternata]|nr:kinase-like protein [Alternaria alternata]
MSSHELINEKGVREYLKAHQSTPISVQLLSGGSANYVYRVINHDGSTRILKHAEPYLHSNKDFAFDPKRMNYEARILQALIFLREPFDRNSSRMERTHDGGSRNLKDAYTDPELDMPYIAEQIGRWLVALHLSARNLSLASPDQDRGIDNNPIAVDIYRYPYNGLHIALTQSGYDPQLAHVINERFGSLVAVDDECICHGDFWPGNVLVRDFEQEPVELTIVDWELVRRGTSATDVGQFAAESFLLDRFRGVHWAVHVAFWPTRVRWSNEEETKALVEVGVATLENILNEDWEKLLESPLLRDVKERMPPSQQFLQEPLPRPLPQPPSALQHQNQATAITSTPDRRVSDKQMLKRYREYEIREGRAHTGKVTNAGVAVTVALKPDGSHFGVQDEAAVDWSGKESDISGMSLSGHRVDKNNGESGQVKKKEG